MDSETGGHTSRQVDETTDRWEIHDKGSGRRFVQVYYASPPRTPTVTESIILCQSYKHLSNEFLISVTPLLPRVRGKE